VGFACALEDDTDGNELYLEADSALYASKAAAQGVHRRFAVVAPAA
jgi:GGDEF domain-containing protein